MRMMKVMMMVVGMMMSIAMAATAMTRRRRMRMKGKVVTCGAFLSYLLRGVLMEHTWAG